MPFPLSFNGKLEFPLFGDSKAVEIFVEDLSLNINGTITDDIDIKDNKLSFRVNIMSKYFWNRRYCNHMSSGQVIVTAKNKKLNVEYKLEFFTFFIIATAMIVLFMGPAIWYDLFARREVFEKIIVNGLPRIVTINKTPHLPASFKLLTLAAMWLFLFGINYIETVIKFRKLVRATFSELVLPVEGKVGDTNSK